MTTINVRGVWSSPREFLLTCIGYCVGLGNVWRFPYLCYRNGGGAFLIAYTVMIGLVGMPMLLMEFSFGQYFGLGGLSIFKQVCPLFQGIGIGYMILNALISIYYNVIIAMALYYIFGSMTTNLPWSTCGNAWNTDSCADILPTGAVINQSTSYSQGESSLRIIGYNNNSSSRSSMLMGLDKLFNGSHHINGSALSGYVAKQRTSSTEEYFRLALLNEQPDIDIENLGKIQWPLCLCLVLAWLLVILFVSRGIHSTGKVAYFTATFPYVMLTVLVIRGATLDGASDGILYFITPEWRELARPEVWYQAATQLFYSTNLAWGGMITMASYNGFNHNCYRDTLVINVVSFLTSIYAGVAVFSIIGYMANEYGVPISSVINSGPGLVFVAYPRALSLMPFAPIWTALFFFMLLLLGIGSQMVCIETVVTGIVDEFPRFGLNRCVRFATTLSTCFVLFLSGVVMTTQGGMYILQLMDHYSAGFGLLFIALIECSAICWAYGHSRLAKNVQEMTGVYPRAWWLCCWKVITPSILLGILVFTVMRYKPAEYNGQLYPMWADVLGWCLSLASSLPTIMMAIYVIYRSPGDSFLERLKAATQPNPNFCNKSHRISLPVMEIKVELSSSSD